MQLPYPNRFLPRAALAIASLPGLAAAQSFGFPDAAGEPEADAPPVYEVEFLIFANNEFNPREEEFGPAVPHSKPPGGVRIRAVPETLQPSSADWYLESLTLRPEDPGESLTGPATDPNTDPTTGDVTAPVDAPGGDYLEPNAGAAPSSPGADELGNAVDAPADATATGRWYELLDADSLQLGTAMRRLANLGAYTPLLHAGWSQAALLEEEAQAFELGLLGSLRPAGSIRLHRSRFLHLTIDISLQDGFRYSQIPSNTESFWPLYEFRGPTRYSIQVQRRIRSGELHFFDHPAFGVLVIVRPAPADPDDPGATDIGPAA